MFSQYILQISNIKLFMRLNIYTVIACIFLATSACKKDLSPLSGCTEKNAINYNINAIIDDGSCNYFSTTPYEIRIPEGFPNMTIPENNPITVEGVILGEMLFNDPILSAK